MSDGNFNRALLPKNELSAGIRAGKSQMRSKAERALLRILDEYFANTDDATRQTIHDRFMQLLRDSQ